MRKTSRHLLQVLFLTIVYIAVVPSCKTCASSLPSQSQSQEVVNDNDANDNRECQAEGYSYNDDEKECTRIDIGTKEVLPVANNEDSDNDNNNNNNDTNINTNTIVDYSESIKDIFYQYDCETILSQPRPIHSPSTWMKMRQVYVDVVTVEESSIPTPVSSDNGFEVPFYVAQTEYAGRGVFAKEDIAKDTLIWRGESDNDDDDDGPGSGSGFTAYMKSAEEYIAFLNGLGNIDGDDGDRGLVCDVLIWCYPEHAEGEPPMIGCDLDEGSLFNEGDNKEEKNLYSKGDGDGSGGVYARRDIKAGEEFLTWYADFTPDGLWALFGLTNVWLDENGPNFEFDAEDYAEDDDDDDDDDE